MANNFLHAIDAVAMAASKFRESIVDANSSNANHWVDAARVQGSQRFTLPRTDPPLGCRVSHAHQLYQVLIHKHSGRRNDEA